MIPKIRQALGFLIAGVLLWFLLKPFVETHTDLKNSALPVQWQWMALSFGVLLLYRGFYTAPFTSLLNSITKEKASSLDTFTLFHLSNITRYLPGRIWGVVRLLSLSPRFGLSKTAVGSSLTLHVGVETVLGGLIAMSLFFSGRMRKTATEGLETFLGKPPLLLTLVGIGVFAGFLFCIPKLTAHAQQLLKTLTPLLTNWTLWVDVITSHSLLWLCQGTAFFLFVRSFTYLQWTEVGTLTACFAFAWIVGFLSFLTPGGLGIREGLLGMLLAAHIPPAQATLVALLCRVWMLTVEIVLAGAAFLLHRHCRVK